MIQNLYGTTAHYRKFVPCLMFLLVPHYDGGFRLKRQSHKYKRGGRGTRVDIMINPYQIAAGRDRQYVRGGGQYYMSEFRHQWKGWNKLEADKIRRMGLLSWPVGNLGASMSIVKSWIGMKVEWSECWCWAGRCGVSSIRDLSILWAEGALRRTQGAVKEIAGS